MLQNHLKPNCIEVGVDEAGRGCLAGDVYAAAVVLPEGFSNDLLNDSKQLSERQRNELRIIIEREAVAWAVGVVTAKEIDEINILQATKLCMKRCIDGLRVKPDLALIDAVDIHTDCRKESVIKGDFKSYTIGAASIVAKVYRDNLMKEYVKEYPEYSFEGHKGYGTKAHIEKIKEIGPCKLHRRTFIKNFWVEPEKSEQ